MMDWSPFNSASKDPFVYTSSLMVVYTSSLDNPAYEWAYALHGFPLQLIDRIDFFCWVAYNITKT
jgi:hypothetical protein